LERFAKPWYRPRALRIFRDDATASDNGKAALARTIPEKFTLTPLWLRGSRYKCPPCLEAP
jgi:hypothetical protein